jgi:uncharacterized membrane protein
MLGDLNFIILWWFLIFTLGLVSLPFTFSLFNKFWDKGYIFSKIISFVVLTYSIFVGGVLKILPFNNFCLVLIIILMLLADVLFLHHKNNFESFLINLKKNYKTFIFQEILFLIILVAWSFVRGFASDIEGLEKYMDWGFINSALRSKFLPPQDMWFSGEIINYYYFGHLIFAVLTKLSNISSAITYNLSIATICALTFVSTFSISSNLVFLSIKNKKIKFKKVIAAGLISALLLTFGGNLHLVYKIVKIDIKNNGHLVLTQKAITKAADSYWYPDATRFIGYDPDTKDKTIHEFPVYSFVVSDLHGHLNDIPIVLFFMAFLLASSFFEFPLINYLFVVVSGFNLSIAYMTNAWDFAIYGLFFAIFTLFLNLKKDSKTAIKKTVINGLLTIFCWFIFSLPFSLSFTPMGNGIRFSDSHTPFYQLFILYGGFWLIVLPFLILIIKNFKLKIKNLSNSDFFVLATIFTATLLIIIPEIIYLKDIYISEYRRANTMFKLVYQAFIMYALVSGYVFYKVRLLLKNKLLNFLYGLLFALIFIIQLIYPYFAIKSFYGDKSYQGLWGLNYLKKDYPDNFKAIEWINQNIKGQSVMLEAVGDSYTTFDQVSVSTGLPTVEGWIVHEWLWRGGYDQPKKRQDDVQAIYESQDTEKLKQLIQKYNIKYIFVGTKEYEKYPKLNEANFKKIGGQIIFQSGKTKVYQL